MTKKTKKSLDLKALIEDHSIFFDKLVELIPAKFYLPIEDKEKVWYQGLSKAAKASAKKESRENTKKARRARLDPEKSTTTLELLKRRVEVEEGKPLADDDALENDENVEHPLNKTHSLTYEELRARYHQKVKELSEGRAPRAENKDKAEKKKNMDKGKRKHDELEDEALKPKNPVNLPKRKENEIPVSLEFGVVKIGNEDESMKKKRKLSKMKVLEKAQKLEEAKKDEERGEIVRKKHSWEAATSRAMGVKVHDDPKLVKQSLKKEKRKQKKSTEKWKERIENVQKRKEEKQQTRKGHIAERVQDKKMRKIAKREKKLMRPGFEGRKEGFINAS
ncbi:ribosomal RNA-processing protein 14-C [Aristolochia californica]|uniref:ribosomal RNA-processing protein 14-C n=1 Tax=Aristolochia californica TaxID=171875 RepID=UPI0035DAC9FC